MIPLLLRDLRGVSKAFLMLQNLCAVLYLLFAFPNLAFLTGGTIDINVFKLFWIDEIDTLLLKYEYISTIFYHLFYAFSSLQCLQYKNMICDPLHYRDYSRAKCITVRVICAVVLSLIFSMDQGCIYILKATGSQAMFKKVHGALAIFVIVKIIFMRAAYTAFLLRTTLKVRKTVAQSVLVRNDNTLRKLLVVVCYIPFGCNVLYFFVDVVSITGIVWTIFYNPCNYYVIQLTLNAIPGVTLITYTICATILCLAYIVLFPNLRRGLNKFCFFSCINQNNEGG